MKKTLGWAVIGCGTISKNHLDAVAKLTHTHLQAVCDIIPARAEEAAKEYGAVKCYTDYLEMLRDPDVDIVSICKPSGMHGDMAIACAAAGKHIFCEKPMDVTHEKMVAMERAARDAGVKFGCVFQRRTYPEALAVRKFIEEHDLGPIIFAEARLKYHRTQEYYDSGDWRATWDLDGGGALMNQGVHGVDLLHWLVGDVKSVYAICRTLAHDIKVEDAAIAVLEFENGAIGTIRGTTCVYPAQETQISLHFKEGSIIFGDEGVTTCEFLDKSIVMPPVKALYADIKDDPTKIGNLTHLPLARDMEDAVLNDHQPAIVPSEAMRSVDLILAIYKSSASGLPVTI